MSCYSRFISIVICVAVQTTADGLEKDGFLRKVADLSLEKHQWIENRLHEISDLMKKADNMSEVSSFTSS